MSKPISVGEYIIVRCVAAGVHAGRVVKMKGTMVELAGARRLWKWRVPRGAPVFLSGVATHGLGEDCYIGTPIDVVLTDACELIRTTQVATKSITDYATRTRPV